jgi:alanyl-tRNA synthetase
MSSTNEIRDVFLNYFRGQGHQIVASAPLVPMNDPTLMFTNAGMVPFKNLFTGAEKPPYARAVSAQKCVRAGGKHNDLDNVGYTARHHTFFEMLGNFSFGDYFKDEAIHFAWELITKTYGIDKDRILVTVFHDDDVAFDAWKKVAGLGDDRIIRIATKDNFWAMGDTGPCGPCSEMFYDHGDHIPGGPPGSADEDGDRFVEIWNLVFMQFEQLSPDKRIDLPRPSIDTGMGLERVAAVLQGTHDNYETDSFIQLIEASKEITGTSAVGDNAVSHRVIADHLRACSFLIADGVLPSNEGRGYVLRRIMRRAMRYAHMLNQKELVMHQLVPTLIGEMGGAYPELGRAQALVSETLKLEESRFKETLDRGLKLLAGEVKELAKGQLLPGEIAFKLYDTYGFPYDLTVDALRRDGRNVERAGYDKAMAEQKKKARASWVGSGDTATEAIWFDIRQDVGGTDFLGYENVDAEGQILAIVSKSVRVNSAKKGDEVMLVANQTPFYGESGGQTGDAGHILTADGARIEISDTKKLMGDIHVHVGIIKEGVITVGSNVEFHVDEERRANIRANHSVTHLLHEALRRTLGEHVTQKGSLVAPTHLRFDISHPKPLSAGEIAAVERDVNARIRGNSEIITRLMTPDEAINEGAMALFGEKYGDEVRVVSMGAQKSERHYSVELCGGTHVTRTGDIGFFKITSESAVAAGIRRIGAISGNHALNYVLDRELLLEDAAAAIKTTPPALPERVAILAKEKKQLERQVVELKKKVAMGGSGNGVTIKEIGSIRYQAQILNGVSAKDLRGLADTAKAKIGSGVVVFIAVAEEKAAILVGVTDDLTGQLSAVDLARIGATAVGGKGGGGRADMAQAGGPEGKSADRAVLAIEAYLASKEGQ